MNRFLKTLENSKSHKEVSSIQEHSSVISKTFFRMELEKPENVEFHAKFKSVDIGPLSFFGCYTNTPLVGVRRINDIDKDVNQDHCLIYLPIKMTPGEQCWHYQGGKQSMGGERIITIVEGSREYRVHRPNFLGLTLIVPYSLLQARLPRLTQYCITPHDATKGNFALAWDFIMSVWFNHESLSEQNKLHYANTIIDLLVVALESEGCEMCLEEGNTKEAYLQRALQYIDDHISSPVICPDVIAENLGIKKRYLYEVFGDYEKSLGTVIREKRLERCYDALSSQCMAKLSVTEIAYRWGFTSYTHFSKVFKEKYNISPKKYRQNIQLS